MAWAINGTPDTLTGTGDTLEITDQTATTFNVLLDHFIMTGGNCMPEWQLNADTANNYVFKKSNNGAADATTTSNNAMDMTTNSTTQFSVHYFINISGEEKLAMWWTNNQSNAGSGQPPSRSERVGKWVNTLTQSSQIAMNNTGAGDYTTDTNLSALGTN